MLSLLLLVLSQQCVGASFYESYVNASSLGLSLTLGADAPLNTACGSNNKYYTGSVQKTNFGCSNNEVGGSNLYTSQSVSFSMTIPNNFGYDVWNYCVATTCSATSPFTCINNGGSGTTIASTPSYSSPTYTCSSTSCCVYFVCKNSVLPCVSANLTLNFASMLMQVWLLASSLPALWW